LFNFNPLSHRQYRYVIMLAVGFLVIITTNFKKFMEVATIPFECSYNNSLCDKLQIDFPEYVIIASITLFLITIAVATMRRVRSTSISNYWVLILSILVFLDRQYLTGLGAVWAGNFDVSIYLLPVPWYLLSAASLMFLLSFASTNSAYFLDGYMNADPPLGYGLSISSFWLLAFSSSKIMLIVGAATGSKSMIFSGEMLQRQFESVLSPLVLSPVIPAVIFITCSILLTLLGRFKSNSEPKISSSSKMHNYNRRQTALRTTNAAQSIISSKM